MRQPVMILMTQEYPATAAEANPMFPCAKAHNFYLCLLTQSSYSEFAQRFPRQLACWRAKEVLPYRKSCTPRPANRRAKSLMTLACSTWTRRRNRHFCARKSVSLRAVVHFQRKLLRGCYGQSNKKATAHRTGIS